MDVSETSATCSRIKRSHPIALVSLQESRIYLSRLFVRLPVELMNVYVSAFVSFFFVWVGIEVLLG